MLWNNRASRPGVGERNASPGCPAALRRGRCDWTTGGFTRHQSQIGGPSAKDDWKPPVRAPIEPALSSKCDIEPRVRRRHLSLQEWPLPIPIECHQTGVPALGLSSLDALTEVAQAAATVTHVRFVVTRANLRVRSTRLMFTLAKLFGARDVPQSFNGRTDMPIDFR